MRQVKTLLGSAAKLLFGLLLAQVLLAGIALAEPMEPNSWSSDNCTGSTWTKSLWHRSDAKSYAAAAAYEGYEWGGGCYKLNNYDDTPGVANKDSGGEGADCSSFVFRAWALPYSGSTPYRYYSHSHYEHGSYTTGDYRYPVSSDPFYRLSSKTYSATSHMDALGYNSSGKGHIGLIYSEGSSNYDWIVEA